jgi:hypothetical protein
MRPHALRTLIFTSCLAVLGIPTSSRALPAVPPLRSPQVPVLTGRLQTYFDIRGTRINVLTDQRDSPLYSVVLRGCLSSADGYLSIRLSRDSVSTDSIGIYDPLQPASHRVRVFPAEARTGWGALLTFSSSPEQLLVVTFDDAFQLRSQTTTVGVSRTNFGFWTQGANGPFYSEDARNPGSNAQILMYSVAPWASEWVCFEQQDTAGASDRDFDDSILSLEFQCPDAVTKSTWGAVKHRFR